MFMYLSILSKHIYWAIYEITNDLYTLDSSELHIRLQISV